MVRNHEETYERAGSLSGGLGMEHLFERLRAQGAGLGLVNDAGIRRHLAACHVRISALEQ